MAIILDAMGSDAHPEPELQAAVEAGLLFGEEIILVGNEEVLRPRLDAINTNKSPVTIVHAPETLEMTDKIEDARRKKQNSMKIGMELLHTGRGNAFVTAGNTGMAMYSAKKTIGDMPGVIRPALTGIFPVQGGYAVVLDIGANAECRPEFLVQFAVMGSVYAEKMMGAKNPRVGLLSNGEEAVKGNDLVKASHHLLVDAGLNFIGNVESKEVFGGGADVVITDGFTGNVLLKTSEAVAKFLLIQLKENLMASPITKIGALLAKPAFDKVRKVMDPNEVGAAPLLGIDGLVFVGHGRSNAQALVSAIRVARQAVQNDLLTALRQAIQSRLNEESSILE